MNQITAKTIRSGVTCGAAIVADYSYSYHPSGQLSGVSRTVGDSWSKSFAYHAGNGLLASETVSIGGMGARTMSYGYDAYLRPNTVTYPDNEVVTTYYGSPGVAVSLVSNVSGTLADSVSYDEAGRMTAIRYPAGNYLWRTQSYKGWNEGGFLNTIRVGTTNGSNDRFSRTYTYNRFGDVLNDGTGSVDFTYDDRDRLTSAYGQSFSYHPTGAPYTFAGITLYYSNNQPVQGVKYDSRGYSYSYDSNGNTAQVLFGSMLVAAYAWDAENRLQSATRNSVTESYAYDADGNRIKRVAGGSTYYTPFDLYEYQSNGTVTKYYVFNGQRIAVRKGGVLSYLHTDHLTSNSVATNSSGNNINAEARYYAYGAVRSGNWSQTDRTFTNQKQDSTGLLYYNARYYDSALGQFLSPDTLVPDAGMVFDYNRYLYARGNPVKYTDPSGHYSDPVLFEHFNCSDWACVESHFNEGGSHAGLWGWLATLIAAEDGDSVTARSATAGMNQEVQGRFVTHNGKIMVTPMRMIMTTSEYDSPINLTEFAGDFSELEFAGRGVGVVGAYTSSRGPGTMYNQRHVDCRHTDCTGRALNAISTGSAAVAAVCAASIVGNAGCTQTALAVSSGAGFFAAARTVIRASLGEAHALDAALAVTLLKAGTQASPLTNLGVNLVQWGWDESISPRLPQPY